VAGFCKHGNEPLGYIKDKKLMVKLQYLHSIPLHCLTGFRVVEVWPGRHFWLHNLDFYWISLQHELILSSQGLCFMEWRSLLLGWTLLQFCTPSARTRNWIPAIITYAVNHVLTLSQWLCTIHTTYTTLSNLSWHTITHAFACYFQGKQTLNLSTYLFKWHCQKGCTNELKHTV